mgnify:CR=1 FL=1|jgi:hypothetical protein
MAFDKSKWSRMTTSANSAIPTMWGYSTTDATATVDSSGYFNGVSGDVQVGDIIMANTSTGGTLAAGFYLVSSNASGVVDVNDALVVTATDTD